MQELSLRTFSFGGVAQSMLSRVYDVCHFYEEVFAVKWRVLFLLMIVWGIRLSVTQSEDRATLRSDPSAALGPKSKHDGWKIIFSSRWRFQTPFLAIRKTALR